ncbi:MAG: GIY-YIG nuclease family protein [Bacteroidales bacterium]
MYILLCSNGQYYTGSTNDLEKRLAQHKNCEGANFTKKHLPVELVYYEEFQRVDEAFYREKQVQGWSRKKKEALINGEYEKLPDLARNYTQYGTSTSSVPGDAVVEKGEVSALRQAQGTEKAEKSFDESVVEPVETTDKNNF